VFLVCSWLHDSYIAPNIGASVVGNWLHVIFIAPNNCVSLVRKLLRVSFIGPSICVPIRKLAKCQCKSLFCTSDLYCLLYHISHKLE
jgi:hypothetical protein